MKVNADRDQLVDDSSDLSFITIELHDDKGTLVTCDDRLITVNVSGAGILQGLGSARPDTTEKFDAREFTTFDGRLLAVIRPTGAGRITVDVTANGLDRVQVTLDVLSESRTTPSDAARLTVL